ncbi:MAG: FeoB-associated Cys-rich membrane protein [Clostridia bacterium]|nr:FeoB-associated Cys-rich membrane protein [Clostridia bacterium]
MITWILNNISTIVICAVLAVVVALIMAHIIKNKRKGSSACGCGCSGCAMKGLCGGDKRR